MAARVASILSSLVVGSKLSATATRGGDVCERAGHVGCQMRRETMKIARVVRMLASVSLTSWRSAAPAWRRRLQRRVGLPVTRPAPLLHIDDSAVSVDLEARWLRGSPIRVQDIAARG